MGVGEDFSGGESAVEFLTKMGYPRRGLVGRFSMVASMMIHGWSLEKELSTAEPINLLNL